MTLWLTPDERGPRPLGPARAVLTIEVGCVAVAVAAAAGEGLIGSGGKVCLEEKAALDPIRQHLDIAP